jgi:hypothetical protein
MDGAGLFLSFLFSLIGVVVFRYGWRQRLSVPTLIGAALMAYPYFVEGAWAVTAIGVALLVALYFGMRLE